MKAAVELLGRAAVMVLTGTALAAIYAFSAVASLMRPAPEPAEDPDELEDDEDEYLRRWR